MKKLITLLLFGLFFISGLKAGTKKVPSDFATIQGAIYASSDGDTVLVSPGRYIENIRFKGKKIIVASLFLTTGDISYILNTIIDGSHPSNSDTTSCVIFVNHEDSSSILEGFTLEKGTGTKWTDEHGAGVYREGGAILSALASPTIKFNLIQNNEGSNSAGIASAGGGGLRCGDGAPRILNNVIINNKALYGGGIVLNYCSGAIVANNIIANNEVLVSSSPTYSGGGIWLNNSNTGNKSPNLIYNNTVVGNSVFSSPSGGYTGGGGILCARGIANFSNNIIWGNTQLAGNELSIILGSTAQTSYNLVKQEIGTNTIKLNPSFADSLFYLTAGSPAVDAGSPDANFNDRSNAGSVIFPSLGNVRNDIGAYGGPGSAPLAPFSINKLVPGKNSYNYNLTLPGNKVQLYIPVSNKGSIPLRVSANAQDNTGNEISIASELPYISSEPLTSDSVLVSWTPGTEKLLTDTIIFNYTGSTGSGQIKVEIKGSSIPTPVIFFNAAQSELGSIDNKTTRKDTTVYVYNNGTAADSVNISPDYSSINPQTALSVSPLTFKLAPGDSEAINFTIFPSLIIASSSGFYTPGIIVKPLSGSQMEKKFRFRLVVSTGIEDVTLPGEFALLQNYPNPFNPATKVKYAIGSLPTGQAGKQYATLEIRDILGREVAVLFNELKEPGEYEVEIDGKNLASGIYFYTLRAGNFSQTRKFILMK